MTIAAPRGSDWRGPLLRALRAGLIAVPIAALLFALFCLANRASLGRDLPAVRLHVQQAFATGVLQDQDWLAGNTDIGRHQYNDCLILWQALDQRAPANELTVSPLRMIPQEPRTLCNSLRGFAHGEAPPPPMFYHRYLHGHTMLARYLLPLMPVEAIRTLYHAALSLIVLAGLAVGMVGLARGRAPGVALFWTILFLVFARWFGLESYGQSLGHGPSDIVNLGYLLFLACMAMTVGIGRRTAIVSAAIFGALVATFEFLTGGIPLGLAAIIGGLPFAVRAEEGDENPTAFVPEALFAFCAAIATCLALKLLLALHMFGTEAITDTAAQLQMRMGLNVGRAEAIDPGLLPIAKKLAKGLGGLAAGMHLLAAAMVPLSIMAGGWGARRLLRAGDRATKARALALLASNLAIAALLLLLWQHTVIHAWFMLRTLAWTIATGLALFALACLHRRA